MNKKFQIKKILIPYDFSATAELALEHAVFMAKLHKADIVLVHVIESFSFTSAISAAFGKTQSDWLKNALLFSKSLRRMKNYNR